jgi:hypothetical protein
MKTPVKVTAAVLDEIIKHVMAKIEKPSTRKRKPSRK